MPWWRIVGIIEILCILILTSRQPPPNAAYWSIMALVLSALHWLPVVFRVDFKMWLLVFKTLHGQMPLYLSKLLSLHTLCGRWTSICWTVKGLNWKAVEFEPLLLQVLNCGPPSLPLSVRLAPSSESFRSLLKSHLFALAFSFIKLELCSS